MSISKEKQTIYHRLTHSKSIPISTLESGQFRPPALKSSPFRPPTQQDQCHAYTGVKPSSTVHAEIKSNISTRKKSNSMRKLITTQRVPARIQKPSQFRPPARNLSKSFPNLFDTYITMSSSIPHSEIKSILTTHSKTNSISMLTRGPSDYRPTYNKHVNFVRPHQNKVNRSLHWKHNIFGPNIKKTSQLPSPLWKPGEFHR